MREHKLGAHSLRELRGVHPVLVAVVRRALYLSPQDFTVHDGLRTVEEQRVNVAAGVSWTMKSKHLEGLAVDLVPYVGGRLRWEWEPIHHVAMAMRAAATEFGATLRWGGCWCTLTGSGAHSSQELMAEYVRSRLDAGRPARPDGPHYELVI